MLAQGLANKSMAKKIVIVVRIFDAYPPEILNRKGKSSIGESRRICIKTNSTLSSNPNCRSGPGFFWQSG